MPVIVLLWIFLVATQDDRAVDALAASLESEMLEERDRAQKALIEMGDAVLPRLKATEARASGESKARLTEIVHEIVLRKEERLLEKAGLPSRLARQVPRFRERFFAADESVVLGCLRETFGGGKAVEEASDIWIKGSSEFDTEQIGAILRSVLGRAKETPLKVTALRLAGHYGPEDFGDGLINLLHDADPRVRRALLESAGRVAVNGAEEAFGRILKEGTEEERQFALRALDRLKTQKARRAILVALEDPSPAVRDQAITELSSAGEEAAIPGIRRLLKDPERSVRNAAVCALWNFRAFDALGDILALEDDPDENVRRNVISLLGSWGDPRGKDAVLRALRRDDEGVLDAITSAASLRLTEALPFLLKLLAVEDAERGERVALAIAEIGPGTHDVELLAMARGQDALLRRRALLSLSSATPSADALAAELHAIADQEPAVRQAAVAALSKASGPDILPALKAALKDAMLRAEVLKILVKSSQPGAGRLAVEFLDDPDREVAKGAFEVIVRHSVVEAIPRLEKLLENPSKDMGAWAASALYHIAGPRGFPAMIRALDRADDETQMRIWSSFALNPDETLVEAAIKWYPRLPEEAQTRAFRVIVNYPSKKSTAFLAAMIKDPKADNRPGAIAALIQRGNAEGLKAAREDFRTLRGKDRVSAAYLLVQFGETDEDSIKVLVEYIKTCEERLKQWMAQPLIEHRRPEAKPFLLGGLRPKEGFGFDLSEGMAHYPNGTFDADLRAMAAEPDGAARRGAILGLTYVETPDRLELLRKLLGDPAEAVRRDAVMALGKVKSKGVPAELEACLADPADEVRKWAVDVVGKLDATLLKSRAEALLADPSAGVREKAAEAVGRGKIPVPPALLEKLLDDRERPVRSAAALSIGALRYHKSAEKLVRKWQDDPSPWVRYCSAHALLEMDHERGLEAMRSLAVHGNSGVHEEATIALMEHADRPSVAAALWNVGRSSYAHSGSNQTLLAMNVFTQPDLYRKLKEVKVDFRGWKGTEREWIDKLGASMGLRVEIEAGIPEFALYGRRHEGLERPLIDELTSLGSFLDAAAVLEPGRLRVMRRIDALDHWERWHREGK